jgi:IS1 family transposase
MASLLPYINIRLRSHLVWLALDTVTREIVGVYIGARDEATAQGLWNSLLWSIVNVPSLTLVFGRLMGQVSPQSGIEPWANKPERQA